MVDENEDIFKRSASQPDKFGENVAVIKKEIEEHNNRLKAIADKLNDPVYIAGIMLAVQNERENTNRILKNIYAELERVKNLEERVRKLEEIATNTTMPSEVLEPVLPDVDAQIVDFIREKTRVCAEDVQRRFNYKGKNAASARLNRLYDMGILNKAQVGRKVYYFLRQKS